VTGDRLGGPRIGLLPGVLLVGGAPICTTMAGNNHPSAWQRGGEAMAGNRCRRLLPVVEQGKRQPR